LEKPLITVGLFLFNIRKSLNIYRDRRRGKAKLSGLTCRAGGGTGRRRHGKSNAMLVQGPGQVAQIMGVSGCIPDWGVLSRGLAPDALSSVS
jgi:hypothetical protein